MDLPFSTLFLSTILFAGKLHWILIFSTIICPIPTFNVGSNIALFFIMTFFHFLPLSHSWPSDGTINASPIIIVVLVPKAHVLSDKLYFRNLF